MFIPFAPATILDIISSRVPFVSNISKCIKFGLFKRNSEDMLGCKKLTDLLLYDRPWRAAEALCRKKIELEISNRFTKGFKYMCLSIAPGTG